MLKKSLVCVEASIYFNYCKVYYINMSAEFCSDRSMIINAVLDGIIDDSYITDDEIYELEERMFEMISDDYADFQLVETLQ